MRVQEPSRGIILLGKGHVSPREGPTTMGLDQLEKASTCATRTVEIRGV